MILDLTDIESYPARVDIVENPACLEIEFESSFRLLQVEVRLGVQKTDTEYFCQGLVLGAVTMECARCLGTFQVRLEGSIDFIVRAPEQKPTEQDVLDDEDYAYFVRNELRADISDLVRQALILAAPMKPVCSDNCRGLCPRCGVNLNERSCTCDSLQSDPRWDDLKRLLDRSQQ